jgi:hypothetical protein
MGARSHPGPRPARVLSQPQWRGNSVPGSRCLPVAGLRVTERRRLGRRGGAAAITNGMAHWHDGKDATGGVGLATQWGRRAATAAAAGARQTEIGPGAAGASAGSSGRL